MSLRTQDFDYSLPPELIAERPLERRDGARMMVLHRESRRITHAQFRDFPHFMAPGDQLVLNDTKVIPARVMSNDGDIELLCLERPTPLDWRCLVRPGKKMRVGASVAVGSALGTVVAVAENGDRWICWDQELDLHAHGRLALPHYMGREEESADHERYQTVYARAEGAIAAPTAGLHFTAEMLQSLPHCFLTLHVGVGTFRPVKVEQIEDHVMHSEHYALSGSSAAAINAATRVIAIGTTVTRVLEHLAQQHAGPQRVPAGDQHGETAIFLHPPHRFRAVDALLTNFHLPQSTLIMLVSAFAGQDFALDAYRCAVAEKYRFYSYGDCMLIL